MAVRQGHLDVMRAFLLLPTSHPFIMRNKHAIAQTLAFLQHGAFDADEEACESREW